MMLKIHLFILFVICPVSSTKTIKENENVPNLPSTSTSQTSTGMINVDSSVKKKRKYSTEEERLAAKIRNNKKYYSQFTKKNVEKAKQTLTGETLQKFLKRYENHKQQRHARYERKQSMKEQSTMTIIHMPKKRREEEIRKANRAASMQIGSKVWSSKKQ